MQAMKRRLGLGILVVLALVCSAVAPAPGDGPPTLRILLTNDDGVGAPGIRAMREALRAAGHELVVVAPSANHSGAGASLTTHGSITLREVESGVHAVDGTPADCVRVALATLLDKPVDLVVSGVNFGQNVGAGTINSGTVGAAVTAASLGVPAVAVSQTVDAEDFRATPRFFPDAAAFAAALVEALAERGERPLLPKWTVLNVNHPARHRAEVKGVKLTRQGRGRLYSLRYERGDEGDLDVSFVPYEGSEVVPDADTTALAAGYVTITPLDGSWTADPAVFSELGGLLRQLTPGSRKAP